MEHHNIILVLSLAMPVHIKSLRLELRTLEPRLLELKPKTLAPT